MLRSFTTFTTLVILSAWAGAQGRPMLSTAEQLKMLQSDRLLIGTLMEDGLGLAKSNTPVEKADSCRRITRTLVDALGRAASDQDADRVAELGGHLETIVRDALAPTIDEARSVIPDDSPEGARLKQVRQKSAEDLNVAMSAIPETSRIGGNTRVKETRSKLDHLRDRLK